MPQKKYLVTLNDEEREQLEQLLHSGTHATRKVTRARILLKAAEGWGRPCYRCCPLCRARDGRTPPPTLRRRGAGGPGGASAPRDTTQAG